uniref:Uncharacterized protein n=1 Tax=Anguilla anguilla TaxID=7936 RepID=A0A0E9XNE1_ANGAN
MNDNLGGSCVPGRALPTLLTKSTHETTTGVERTSDCPRKPTKGLASFFFG